MYASKYADPDAIIPDIPNPRRKQSNHDNLLPSLDVQPATPTKLSSIHRRQLSKAVDATPSHPLLADSLAASHSSSKPNSTAKTFEPPDPILRWGDSTPPPLPHVADIESTRSLPSPTIILGSSPSPTQPQNAVAKEDVTSVEKQEVMQFKNGPGRDTDELRTAAEEGLGEQSTEGALETPKDKMVAPAAETQPPTKMAEPSTSQTEDAQNVENIQAKAQNQTTPIPITAQETIQEAAVAPEPAQTPLAPVKAKRSQRGKPCPVRLPKNDGKLYHGFTLPMSAEEVASRINAHEKSGYDTRGYTFWNHDQHSVDFDEQAQGRAIYPDAKELSEQAKAAKPAVSIPNKQLWDDYVHYLTEEKLRRLGVSSGDESSRPSLSRQVSASTYPTMPFTPPLPPSSSASQHKWATVTPFSAPFSPANSASFVSAGGFMSSSPQPLSSTPRPGQLGRQMSQGYLQQVPASRSPQQVLPSTGFVRGASPAIAPDFQKPLPTLPEEASESPQSSAKLPPLPATPVVSTPVEDGADVKDLDGSATPRTGSSQPEHNLTEVASPRPIGHRSNISANLEREAEQYYPGEYVHGELVPNTQAAKGAPVTLNPASVPFSASASCIAAHQTPPSLVSTTPTSHLNVAAPEFKFNPSSAHGRHFSMGKNAFMPAASARTAKPGGSTAAVSLATAHSRQGSVTLSNLNVKAPEFKPPTSKNFAFSGSWFNFSKNPPVDTVLPKDGEKSTAEPERKTSASFGTSIFGNLADIIVKPPKESKALPIINPSEIGIAQTIDSSDREAEDGRPDRAEGRVKKGRFTADGGDEVPRFAEPTPEPESLIPPAPPVPPKSPARPASAIAPVSIPSIDAEVVGQEARPEESKPTKLVPLELDYELDLTGNTSDASTVPWHGIESEQRRATLNQPQEPMEDSLLAASPPSSGAEDAAELTEQAPSSGRDAPDAVKLPYPPSPQTRETSELPRFAGADDMLDYINDDNSDLNSDFGFDGFDVSKLKAPLTPAARSPAEPSSVMPEPPSIDRGVFSPSPERHGRRMMSSIGNLDLSDRLKDDRKVRASASPVRRLNKLAETPVSDWDDMLSSGQELRIPQQNHVSEAHIAGLLEGLLKRHFAPFEKRLDALDASLKRDRAREPSNDVRPMSSYDKSNSDADDEDDLDEEGQRQLRRVKSDRRMSQVRTAVKEALISAQSGGLQQIEQEVKFRKAAENRADDAQRLLELSEKEISLFKEASANADEKIRSLEDERADASRRHQRVEEELRSKTLQFTAEIASLEDTLDEFRASGNKWKEEIDAVKEMREKLQKTIDSLRAEAAESTRERDSLTERVVTAEEALATAQKTLAEERSIWERQSEVHSKTPSSIQAEVQSAASLKEEHAATTAALEEARALHSRAADQHVREMENLQHKLDEANNLKQKLGAEIDRLSDKEKEAIRSGVMLEETRNAKSNLETLVQEMTEKNIEQQSIVARFEREVSQAREDTAAQVERAKSLLEIDIEIAKKQVENVQADLGTRLAMARQELENVRKDHDAVRGRYERSLDEANAGRKEALQEANTVHYTRLKEERERFDQRLEEMSEQHNRALRNALQDKQRSEDSLHSQLELAHAKIAQLSDKVSIAERRSKETEMAADERVALLEQRISAGEDAADAHAKALEQRLSASHVSSKENIALLEQRLSAAEEAAREKVTLLEQRLSSTEQAAKTQVVSLEQRLADAQKAADERASSLEQRLSTTQATAQEKAKLMEERVSVAQSAAQAAIAAAQNAKAGATPSKTTAVEIASPSGGLSRTITIPTHLEKVSPQALRESIVVLQEQLQEREARIERLESSSESSEKLGEAQSEVTWLRELLNVRMDDLSDLVNSLQLEKFDRGAARNAAIRIKANLQMEQQERDRLQGGARPTSRTPPPVVSLPSLTDLQNFATPKAAQLTAAWASFKKGPPSLAGFRESQGARTPTRASRAASPRFDVNAAAASARPLEDRKVEASSAVKTGKPPAKPLMNPMAAAAASNVRRPTEAQSFLSGLMTPPASNLRRTPSTSSTASSRPSGPNTARPRTPSRTTARPGIASLSGSPEKPGLVDRSNNTDNKLSNNARPSTPPLTRSGDYDLDAELGDQNLEFEDDDDETETAVAASPAKKIDDTLERTRLQPLGEVVADEA